MHRELDQRILEVERREAEQEEVERRWLEGRVDAENERENEALKHLREVLFLETMEPSTQQLEEEFQSVKLELAELKAQRDAVKCHVSYLNDEVSRLEQHKSEQLRFQREREEIQLRVKEVERMDYVGAIRPILSLSFFFFLQARQRLTQENGADASKLWHEVLKEKYLLPDGNPIYPEAEPATGVVKMSDTDRHAALEWVATVTRRLEQSTETEENGHERWARYVLTQMRRLLSGDDDVLAEAQLVSGLVSGLVHCTEGESIQPSPPNPELNEAAIGIEEDEPIDEPVPLRCDSETQTRGTAEVGTSCEEKQDQLAVPMMCEQAVGTTTVAEILERTQSGVSQYVKATLVAVGVTSSSDGRARSRSWERSCNEEGVLGGDTIALVQQMSLTPPILTPTRNIVLKKECTQFQNDLTVEEPPRTTGEALESEDIPADTSNRTEDRSAVTPRALVWVIWGGIWNSCSSGQDLRCRLFVRAWSQAVQADLLRRVIRRVTR